VRLRACPQASRWRKNGNRILQKAFNRWLLGVHRGLNDFRSFELNPAKEIPMPAQKNLELRCPVFPSNFGILYKVCQSPHGIGRTGDNLLLALRLLEQQNFPHETRDRKALDAP
jgi:hypothetical protein